MIAIVEYEGNLRSVQKGFEYVGANAIITSDPDTLRRADAIVLPGQGAFGTTMQRLNATGVADTVRDAILSGKPYLGICLGLQVLFDASEEAPGVPGLGVLKGSVVRFDSRLKVPHMGWNQLRFYQKPRHFERVDEGAFVYFVHSYYVVPDDANLIAATTDYGIEFVSAVFRDNVCATQFHPEKSQSVGLSVLRSFARIVAEQQ
jgi:glutamine amidotransferase